MRILNQAGRGAAASNTNAARRLAGCSRSKAETYNVGERKRRRLLRGIGVVTPEEALAPLQRPVLHGEQFP